MDRIKDSRLTLLIGTLLGAVTFLVYWPVRHFDFLNWDDSTYISRNDHVRGGLTWNGVIWSFTHSYSSNWHPLTWLSHMLDCQLYGLNPAGPHLTNVAFHTANTVLLFVLLKEKTMRMAIGAYRKIKISTRKIRLVGRGRFFAFTSAPPVLHPRRTCS